jgi:hypothetical protein
MSKPFFYALWAAFFDYLRVMFVNGFTAIIKLGTKVVGTKLSFRKFKFIFTYISNHFSTNS